MDEFRAGRKPRPFRDGMHRRKGVGAVPCRCPAAACHAGPRIRKHL
ncbi:hypothetical protein GCM10011534_43570 [Pseudooceanicola nanhaiensis]|uniref:Uncharacterized protein n=1 Tax=Pseudooceanicola nanhaiensis TaxID=375761 RepID=A0A917TAY2_9RHOB|nr:hypothetical protein GCM10011534_43570 [Pseudooceanicola nanhaiensis]